MTVRCGAARLDVTGVVAPAPAAALRLTSPHGARWTVTDATGGAWFAEGAPRKWDAHHRPFFHADTVTLAIPAGPLQVVAARGLEFERLVLDVEPAPGPARRAARRLMAVVNRARAVYEQVAGASGASARPPS